MTTVALLRGRVAIRPDESGVSAVLWTPSQRNPLDRSGARTGVVIAMGPPALTPMRWHSCGTCPPGRPTGSNALLDASLEEAYKDYIASCLECSGLGGSWRGGVEIAPDFKVGDRVAYAYGQITASLPDNPDLEWCAQEEILGVVEP